MPLKTPRSAPSSALRGPASKKLQIQIQIQIQPRSSLKRQARSPPQVVANAARRLTNVSLMSSSVATRTRTLGAWALIEDGDEKVQQPRPPLVLPPPPPPPRLALPLAWHALEAALWPELVITWISAKKREVTA